MNGKDICGKICYGCTACHAICPRSAIKMEENEKGFLYPVIDSSLCIDCGLCRKACSQKNEYNLPGEAFIAKHKDEEAYLHSQSGGAFTALSDIVLKAGGLVYGAALDESFEAMHARAVCAKERDAMRGSKYVQSRMEDIYAKVERDMEDKIVLFSGTPCQIGGLLKYLRAKGIDAKNLYTVDIICHGVPSVKVWRDLMGYYEKKEKSRIERVIFRDKGLGGWRGHITTFYLKKKQISDAFHRKLFYTNLALRDSCFTCEYAQMKRVSDFTIGDAWGVENRNPEFYDRRGVSLLMFHTEKAKVWRHQVEDAMEMKRVEVEEYRQGNMIHPSLPHRDVDEFWDDYRKKSFRFILSKYARNNIFLNIHYILRRIRGINK